jgi:hypothetical protein
MENTNPESLGQAATAKEVPDVVRVAAQPAAAKGEPKTLRCRVLDHDPSRRYQFHFSWPKLGADGQLGTVLKKAGVPEGGEPTFLVSVPPGAKVTLGGPGLPVVTFRAEEGVTTEQLIAAWVG